MNILRNMSVRDKKVALYLIGILLIAIAYFAVFNPVMDVYSNNKAEQDEIQSQVDLMNEVNVNMDEYRSKTASYKKEINEFMGEFDVDLKEEDDILFAKSLEDKTYVDITTVSLSQRYFVYTMGSVSETTTTNQGEVLGADVTLIPETLYSAPSSLEIEGTYEQIKNCLVEIILDNNRKEISTISLSYDDTMGKLFGNIAINNYFLTDSSRTYTAPELNTITLGLDDLFGTINIDTAN